MRTDLTPPGRFVATNAAAASFPLPPSPPRDVEASPPSYQTCGQAVRILLAPATSRCESKDRHRPASPPPWITSEPPARRSALLRTMPPPTQLIQPQNPSAADG